MQAPGSNPQIPEHATIEFKTQWNRARPGTTHKIGFLQLRDGGRLAVFPHKDWDPPLAHKSKCVLFPVRNAAVAAPVGGVPEGEEATGDVGSSAEISRSVYETENTDQRPLKLDAIPKHLRQELATRINALLIPAYQSLNGIDDLIRELDPSFGEEEIQVQ